jgi:glycogen debranching enzyme
MNGFKEPRTISKIRNFLNATENYISQNAEPGDYYKAVWCRDAAYILKDQFLSGHRMVALQQLKYIWKNQIGNQSQKLIYGRGSPETDFTPLNANGDLTQNFYGALPTTIYSDFSEVYALNPDIDSTALIIYVTSWLLNYMIMLNQCGDLRLKESEELVETTSFLIPFLFRGIDYLLSRDVDGDGLLEQDYNEDWMDTVLRGGKIVYSQACWLLGLSSFAKLLYKVNEDDKKAKRLLSKACELVDSIEAKMWSDKSRCYMDVKSDRTISDGSTDILYQDTIFYLFAITEMFPDMRPAKSGTLNTQKNSQITQNSDLSNIVSNAEKIQERMIMSLQSLKDRVWLRDIPLVTEKPLLKTGPWILQAHEYHNYTHWPWITAIELLTRFRYGQINECNILLSNLFRNNGGSKKGNDKIFYEWVDPSTLTGGGAYPFRTGISAYRLAAFEIISNHTI